jgi:hypothetical protein
MLFCHFGFSCVPAQNGYTMHEKLVFATEIKYIQGAKPCTATRIR